MILHLDNLIIEYYYQGRENEIDTPEHETNGKESINNDDDDDDNNKENRNSSLVNDKLKVLQKKIEIEAEVEVDDDDDDDDDEDFDKRHFANTIQSSSRCH